jgi:dTDP-4-amino-4,6-dideoxygalactose transaminase
VLAYNALLEPNLYGLVSRNPWLKLGRTAYKPLLGIAAMDESRRSLLSANIAIYLQRSCAMEKNLFAATPSSMHMPASLSDRCGRLLRFPLLCRDGHQQQQLLSRLRKAGLGATAMYQRPLPLVDGVEGRVTVQSNLRGAAEFAQRLITLPLHSHISARDVQNIADIFAALS